MYGCLEPMWLSMAFVRSFLKIYDHLCCQELRLLGPSVVHLNNFQEEEVRNGLCFKVKLKATTISKDHKISQLVIYVCN